MKFYDLHNYRYVLLDSGAKPSPDLTPCFSATDTGSGLMKKYHLSDKVTTAEILWALQTIITHNSNRGSGEQVSLFSVMYPDSEIAAKLELGRTKIGYLITHG